MESHCMSSLIVEVVSRPRQLECDLFLRTDVKSRILGISTRLCTSTSNSLCQYMQPDLRIFAISMPIIRNKHLQQSRTCQPVHIPGHYIAT
jgi:hypothetical protein